MTSVSELDEVLREDFCSFVQHSFHEVQPQVSFAMNWHLEVLAAKLDEVRRGTVTRLVVNLPPRHLKSICASVALPAWVLGHDPGRHILCVSYAQDLSDKLARDSLSVMRSAWYQRLFRTRLSSRRQAVAEFETTAGGFRLATSVGGVLTGRGADLIIIDDPLKPDEALSDSQRRSANEWFDGTLFSRLNNKQHGAIVIIMQRLHEDDLVGHVLEQEGWEILRFSAIAEADEVHETNTALFGPRRYTRRAGEPLHADRESIATLDGIRRTLGEYNYAGQYQQAPAPAGGGLVKREWFVLHDPADWPDQFEQVVQSWDTANTAGELSDYSVCTTWGVKGQHVYLLHVLRRQMAYPDLKRSVREQHRLHAATVVIIEDKASGTQLIQELVSEGMHAVKKYQPKTDKVMRLNAQTGTIENGFVHLQKNAPWLELYLHELATVPRSKYDDQADSTAQFLDWFKRPSVSSPAGSGRQVRRW